MFAEMTSDSEPDLYDPAATGSLAEAIVRHLPPDSPVPAYLRRLLLADGEAGRELFGRLYRMSTALMDVLVEAGLASAGADPAVRAAFLMANDLAVLLLRDHLADVLGVDPLSGEGMTRWAREVLAIYAGGLIGQPDEGGNR
jgi:TetR/AcrR family transcriptional regulator, regulator of cefoperazone and chloramphenicol sensitivity